jgi:hypothetical protein
MKVGIIGTGRSSHIEHIIDRIEAMGIPELEIVVVPELPREPCTIIVDEAEALSLADLLNSYSGPGKIHDAFYALAAKAPQAPTQEPIIREKKKKLPWRKRKFARYN